MAEEVGVVYHPTEGKITREEMWRVGQNVLIVLSIVLFLTMCTIGGVFFKSCPSQPMLAIYMIVQGGSGLSMPGLYILKYRTAHGAQIKRVFFLTLVIVIVIVSIGWLIAGTHWMATAGCHDSDLYRAGIAFMVFLWITVAITVVTFFLKCSKMLKTSNDRNDEW